MKRKFRLTSSKDFQRVRLFGKSYAHPLIVLVVLPNQMAHSRIGVIAGRSLGGAVQRNRAKRRLRAALSPLIAFIQPGWDLILIARQPMGQAQFGKSQAALTSLLLRSGLMREQNGLGFNPHSSAE